MVQRRVGRRRFIRTVGGAGLVGAAGSVLAGSGALAVGQRKPPHQWPKHCLDRTPQGPDDYQAAFDYRRGGWAGADGGWPILLPDKRILWLFGDTFIGEIDENNAMLPGYHMVRSAQVQMDRCFTPLTNGTAAEPRSFLPDLDGTVFWAAGGYVDPTAAEGSVVRVPATGVCTDDQGWYVCKVMVHTLLLPDLAAIRADPAPYDPTVPDMPSFGQKIFHDGDVVYLYGYAGGFQRGGAQHGNFEPGMYVARAPADKLIGPWEYWTGPSPDAWSSDVGQAKPMVFDPLDDPRHRAFGGMIRWRDGYLMTGKNGRLWVYGKQVYAWYAESPAGPWQQVRQDGKPVDLVPADVSFPQSRTFYGGFLVSNVPGTSAEDPMLVFSTNGIGCDPVDNDPACTPDNAASMNVMLYGPHFVRPVGLPPVRGRRAVGVGG